MLTSAVFGGVSHDGVGRSEMPTAASANLISHTTMDTLVLADTYVTVYTTVTPLDDGTDLSAFTCSTKVNVYKGSSSGSSSSSYMIGFSAVMIAGLGAFFYKRRRAAKIDLTKEEAMLGNFEMMNDSGVRV